ncbi:MAG: SDR family oxidoreductase [Methanomassiliicoccales archaeon]
MSKVAIIGGSGLLGQYLVGEAVSRGHEVVSTYNGGRACPGAKAVSLDMTDQNAVEAFFSKETPDRVLLPAAMTDVDECERKPQLAFSINVEGTMNVAAACGLSGATLLYVSTDYVFNGFKGSKYFEFETPDPLSIYSKTKLEGERLVIDSSKLNAVCRVAVLYGWNRLSSKDNFASWVIRSVRAGKEIRLFEDQYVTATYAPHCANVLMEVSERGLKGLFHTSGPDCLSRYQMGLIVADVFDLDRSLIKPSKMADAKFLAKRAENTCLNVENIEAQLDMSMMSFRAGIEDMKVTEPTL